MGGKKREVPPSFSMKKNFSFSVLGNTFYSISQWALLIIIAQLSDTETLGTFGLAIALTTPFYAFSNLRSRQYLVTDSRKEYEIYQYLQIRFLTSLASLILIFALAFVYTSDTTQSFAILLIGIGKFVETFSDIYRAVFQKYERLDFASKAIAYNGIVNIIAFGLTMLITKNLLCSLASLAASRVFILALESRWMKEYFNEKVFSQIFSLKWEFNHIWKFAKKASPLGLMTLLVSLNTNTSRYFLEYFHGVGSLGIYTALSYFMYAGTTICGALAQSTSSQVAQRISSIDSRFYKLFWKLIFFSASVGILGILISYFLGEYILTFVYGDEYSGLNYILTIFMTSAAMMYVYGFLSVVLTAMREIKIQGTLSILSLLTSSIAAYLLVPHMGTLGAAYSTLIGSFIYFAGSSISVARGLKAFSDKQNITP